MFRLHQSSMFLLQFVNKCISFLVLIFQRTYILIKFLLLSDTPFHYKNLAPCVPIIFPFITVFPFRTRVRRPNFASLKRWYCKKLPWKFSILFTSLFPESETLIFRIIPRFKQFWASTSAADLPWRVQVRPEMLLTPEWPGLSVDRIVPRIAN